MTQDDQINKLIKLKEEVSTLGKNQDATEWLRSASRRIELIFGVESLHLKDFQKIKAPQQPKLTIGLYIQQAVAIDDSITGFSGEIVAWLDRTIAEIQQ